MSDNIRQTSAPIPIDLIKEYFSNKELFFEIDYKTSELRDKVFLTYISNLDLPVNVVLSDDVTEEETFSLLASYMTIKSVCSIERLNMMAVQVLLQAKGVGADDVVNPYMTSNQVHRFIMQNIDTVTEWVHFIDSTLLFLIYIYTDLNEQVKVEENNPIIDNPDFVGLNVVNVFSVPGFLELYFSAAPIDHMSFFTQQFTTHMFRGKSLFDYYNNEANMFIPLLVSLVEKKVSSDPREIFPAEMFEES